MTPTNMYILKDRQNLAKYECLWYTDRELSQGHWDKAIAHAKEDRLVEALAELREAQKIILKHGTEYWAEYNAMAIIMGESAEIHDQRMSPWVEGTALDNRPTKRRPPVNGEPWTLDSDVTVLDMHGHLVSGMIRLQWTTKGWYHESDESRLSLTWDPPYMAGALKDAVYELRCEMHVLVQSLEVAAREAAAKKGLEPPEEAPTGEPGAPGGTA